MAYTHLGSRSLPQVLAEFVRQPEPHPVLLVSENFSCQRHALTGQRVSRGSHFPRVLLSDERVGMNHLTRDTTTRGGGNRTFIA
jgi:hypothetical protein